MMTLRLLSVTLALMLMTAVFVYNSEEMKNTRLIKQLVAHNVEARGGKEAWQDVSSLRLTGQMDIGNGMQVPYVLEQKRPGKMRLQFVFNGATAVQSTNGETGWKLLPFRGRPNPELMTEQELRESADSTDLYGLLFAYAERDIDLEFLGQETVAGRDAFKLKATLPRGAERWIYLDAETGLEIKLETQRMLGGHLRIVKTMYSDWQRVEGLLISHRQEIQTEGDDDGRHFVTVESVVVNPQLNESHFRMSPTVL